MDAWDLVMRGLSHYWRLTRQDNMVAQALLEKATAIDPNYGQALGVLAASHTFGSHMGWADMAASVLLAERAAMAAIRADSEDPWGTPRAGQRYLFTRRFDDSLAEFELALQLNPNFSLAQAYYGLTLSYCGRWQDADLAARRALRNSVHEIRFLHSIMASPRTRSSMGVYVEARRLRWAISWPPGRFGRWLQGAHRRRRNGWTDRRSSGRPAGASTRATEHLDGLACAPDAVQHDADRKHYLEGFRRAGLD